MSRIESLTRARIDRSKELASKVGLATPPLHPSPGHPSAPAHRRTPSPGRPTPKSGSIHRAGGGLGGWGLGSWSHWGGGGGRGQTWLHLHLHLPAGVGGERGPGVGGLRSDPADRVLGASRKKVTRVRDRAGGGVHRGGGRWRELGGTPSACSRRPHSPQSPARLCPLCPAIGGPRGREGVGGGGFPASSRRHL